MRAEHGFITMATGNELYYKLAANMLLSYKVHGGNLPFTIICDRTNRYTKAFDNVIILPTTSHNYLDKFQLFLNLPYEKNFFIEPDCLIYKNIDCIFDVFENAPDFFAFNVTKADFGDDGWFEPAEPIKRRYPDLNYFWGFNPGYMYFKNTPIMNNLYQDCMEIAEYLNHCPEYKQTKLFFRDTLRDDPVIWLSAAKNIKDPIIQIDTHTLGKPISLPGSTIIHISQKKEKLDIIDQYDGSRHDNNFLLHFSTARTKEGLYSHQFLMVKMMKYAILNPLVALFEKDVIRNTYVKAHKFVRGVISKKSS